MPKKFYGEAEKQKRFYSVKEASKIIGVSTNTIYKYLDGGSLKGKRLSNRGRFKIPYSEVAPYLTQVVPDEPANTVAEVADSGIGNKSSFFGPLLETVSIGLGALLILWGVGSVTLGAEPTLMKNIGGAVLSYSGRTFSGFGNLISQLTPAKKTEKSEVASAEVSAPVVETTIPEEKPQDLNNKLKDTERLIYELYANTQTLDASAQKLLGKERTLTTAELNDAVVGMLQLLGASSGSPDESTIYAQVNNLTDSWNFPALVSLVRSLDQMSSGLDLITKGSLGAFTKPEVKDINDLIAQTDLLQRLVGNITDTTADATVFGDLRKAEAQAKALDAKNAEIDKILADWSSYDISEKENSVKTILSDTLSINILPQVVGVLPANLSGQVSDADLKNMLLSAKEILEANKTHMSQKANAPVAVTWAQPEVKQTAVIQESAKIAENIASPTPESIPTPEVAGVSTQDVPVEVTPTPTAVPRVVAAVTQAVPSTPMPTPAPKVAPEVKTTGVVAGASATDSETQRTVGVGIGFLAIGALVVYLLTLGIVGFLFKIARLVASGVKKMVIGLLKIPVSIYKLVVKILLLVKKLLISLIRVLYKVVVAVLMFPVKVVSLVKNFFISLAKGLSRLVTLVITSIKRLVVSAVKATVTFVSNIISAVKALFESIISAITKAALSIKTGILIILSSIKAFFLKMVGLLKNLIVSIVAALFQAADLTKRVLTRFVKGVVSLIIKMAVSVKTGMIRTLNAIRDLILNIISSITKFIVTTVVSIKKGIQSVINAIAKFIVSVVLAVKNFFVKTVDLIIIFVEKVILAVTKAITFVITSVIRILVSVETFFLKAVLMTAKALVSPVKGLLKILVAVTERADSTLTNIHFEPLRFRGSRIHYRRAAVFILVLTLSAVISSVFAITVMAQI